MLNGYDISDVATESDDHPTNEDDHTYFATSCRKDTGASHIILQEARLHRGAMTLLEHQNLWANMRSIDPILFGEYAVPGYWWIPELPIDSNDFSSSDFSPGDFLT
jgi:hypothetical protein